MHPAENHISKQSNALQLYVGVTALLLMMVGFLLSRALLSISMGVLFLNAFWPGTISGTWRKFKKLGFHWWTLLYFLVYLVGGLWSENKVEYLQHLSIKIPFILMPWGFCALPLYDLKVRRLLILSIVALLTITVFVSLGIFASNYQFYVNSYQHSKLIPTTIEGDHIRFGLALSLSLLLITYLLREDKWVGSVKWLRFSLFGICFLFFIYLHILSAKTGLMVLYFVLFAIAFYFISKKVNTMVAIVVPLLLGGLFLFGAYKTVPTFQKKIDYVLFEIELMRRGEKLDYNYSDMGRLISYDIAFQQIKKRPIIGTGTGDIMAAMHEGYDEKYSEVPSDTRFVPINQYLCEVLSFGWFLSLIFVGMVISPFFATIGRGSYFLYSTAVAMILSMMVEAMLQIQLGGFIYLFFTCLWFAFKPPKTMRLPKQVLE